MTDFVLDCSVTMSWCFEDETCDIGERALDTLAGGATAFVPGLWALEVANVLLMAERRKRLTRVQADAFTGRLGRLPIILWEGQFSLVEMLEIGRRHRLTAYDAAYLALAATLNLPLATFDRDLAGALAKARLLRF